MTTHKVNRPEQSEAARAELLTREKEPTHPEDELAARRGQPSHPRYR